MKPDRCSFCKGRLVEGETGFAVKELLSIKDVPAYICEECGEACYTPEVSKKIDKIMAKFHESDLFVHYAVARELSLDELFIML